MPEGEPTAGGGIEATATLIAPLSKKRSRPKSDETKNEGCRLGGEFLS